MIASKHNEMCGDLGAQRENEYYAHERNDRLHPTRSNRIYCHLSQLRDKLAQIISSLPEGDVLVDFGCGNKPYYPLFKSKYQKYLGADIAGNADAELIITPAGILPLSDGVVDCVLSSQVLEHVINPKQYLSEALRVLKRDGLLILSTHGMWPYHPDPTDYWRWTIDGLQREIQCAGFEVMSVQSVFGMESVAVQLWQDSTVNRLPAFVRNVYTWICQSIILLIENRQPAKLSNDASVYIVVAKKVSLPQSD